MIFRIEQVALCPPDPAKAKQLLTDMGAGDLWVEDHVTAVGEVHGVNAQNEADLSFNYSTLSHANELEVLNYTQGPNWMDDKASLPRVSHFGMHCEESDIDYWRSFFAARGIVVAQEVYTRAHTNPAIAGRRQYHYIIFDTYWILGVDIKFIIRKDTE